MDSIIKKIIELEKKIKETWDLLSIPEKKEELSKKKEKMNEPDFWDNRDKAVEISKEVEEVEKEILSWEELKKESKDLREITREAEKEKEEELEEVLENKLKELEERFSKLEFNVLFTSKYDEGNVIISLHAGTGGVDAQDWAQILERMLLRFAEKKGWKVEQVERTVGAEAGIKSVVYRVAGRMAYGNLKSENGVHRLVRISPFDAEAMRHTSFALVEVIPELPETEEIEIKEEDIRIDVFKSSGPGGQGVNTTDSAVRMVHTPSKTTVVCQTERSQHQNKETAMKILKSKLFKLLIATAKKATVKLVTIAPTTNAPIGPKSFTKIKITSAKAFYL